MPIVLVLLLTFAPPALAWTHAVSAQGKHDITVRIPTGGRYAIRASGPAGVALRLVSRLRGPGPWHGKAGEQNGAWNTFIEAGVHRIDTWGAEGAAGSADVAVLPFAELNTAPLELQPVDNVSTTLAQGQARSFWVTLTEAEQLILEAAGRSLEGLHIRRDGRWILRTDDAFATVEEPSEGRPLRFVRLSTALGPGRYRVSAYGGAVLDWADGSEEQPLYLRRGIPRLPSTYRAAHKASPFGVDRFWVPARAGAFRLELPLSARAAIGVSTIATPQAKRRIFAAPMAQARISDASKVPIARLYLDRTTPLAETGGAFDLVTVERQAHASYTLQMYVPTGRAVLRQAGEYWVESVIPGAARDELGANGLLFVGPSQNNDPPLDQEALVILHGGVNWQRRFNLTAKAQAWLRVVEPGSYKFTGSGVRAAYAVRPYSRPRTGKWQAVQPDADGVVELVQGYYRLTITPERPGVHGFGLSGARASGAAVMLPSVARFTAKVAAREQAIIRLTPAQGEDAGLLVRKLPLTLKHPLAMTLDPGAPTLLPLRLAAPGTLSALGPGTLEVRALPGPWAASARLDTGPHHLEVRNRGAAPVQAMLRWQPEERASPAEPTPVRPPDRLTLEAPRQVRLHRDSPAQFEIHIPRDGLYALGTTGLLATVARVSSPLVPALYEAKSNGMGRNALIEGYLPKGEYLLDVATLGKSEGLAGVFVLELRLDPMPGVVTPDGAVAMRVAAGSGRAGQVRVAEDGRYRLRVMGAGHHRFNVALSDAGGLPLVAPGSRGEVELDLKAGSYPLRIFPPAQTANVVADMTRLREPALYDGRGPHELALGQMAAHRWLQPEAGTGQIADIWAFTLSAPAEVTLAASNGMTGTLAAQAPGQRVATLLADKSWRGELPAGRYQARLSHGRKGNRIDYTVAVSVSELLPGQTRRLRVPRVVPASLTEGRFVFRSHGDTDVRAELVNRSGVVVARADDSEGNWNFALLAQAKEERYSLHVYPVAAESGVTTVSLTEVGGGAGALAMGTPEDEVRRLSPGASSVTLRPGTVAKLSLHDHRLPGLVRINTQAVAPALDAPGLAADAKPGAAALAWLDSPRNLTLKVAAQRAALAHIRLDHFSHGAVAALSAVGTPLTIEGGTVRQVRLLEGRKRLVMDLPALAHVLVDGATIAAAPEGERVTVETDARELWLFNPGERSLAAALSQTVIAGERGAPVSVRYFSSPGRWRITRTVAGAGAVEGSGSLPLQVFGAARSSKLLRPQPASAVLEIGHSAGLTAVWMPTAPADLPAQIWGSANTGATVSANTRLVVPRGRTGLLRVFGDDAAVLHWRAAGTHEYALLAGASHDFLLTGQPGTLAVLAPTSGARVFAQQVPALPLTEGLSEPVWLGPGMRAAFHLHLRAAADIGVGARAQRGVPQAHFHDERGEVLAQGVIQRHRLEAGHYWLVVSNPPGMGPRSVQAALVGTSVPGHGPPAALVEKYLADPIPLPSR